MTTQLIQPKMTEQQLAVLNAVKTLRSNLMVTAVAGSGKTFILIEILKILGSGNIAFCAFNKNISNEIKDKVSQIKGSLKCNPFVGTFHSFGLSAITKIYGKKAEGWIDNNKIDKLMDIVQDDNGLVGVPDRQKQFVRKAYSLSRQAGAGVLPEFPFGRQESWMSLIEHFDLEDEFFSENEDRTQFNIDELVAAGIKWTIACIKLGVKVVETIIDFEDMIFIPLFNNLKMWTYPVVLVDECQDINPSRRALTKKMVATGGRAIFVGDERQAIFGFTGADSDSVPNIIKEFNCTLLPLSYSFRCPKAVVQFAKTWVDHIESTPDAPEGSYGSINEDEMMNQNITVNDVILCRNNAPLVDLFFKFLAKGMPTHIEGKDIGEDLIKVINRFSKVKNLSVLAEKLDDYREKQIQKWNAKGKEMMSARIADTVDAILAISRNLPEGSNVLTLKQKITNMFIDDQGNRTKTLTLTSIHKSKGREWNRVFWYGRNLFNPSPYARKEWQRTAEANLCYVAATRSKMDLIEVMVSKKVKA